MKDERWERIERLYHAARELSVEQQSRFLDEACVSDVAMRRQIEVLLKQDTGQESFLNTPALEFVAGLSSSSPLSPGTRLGLYEVLGFIGAGGMGEVYRAHDPRLGRDVAIKVLPAEFSADPERLRRFEQEARAAAALNHPHICTIHDIGEHDGQPYIVMELLEGHTLKHRIATKSLETE